MMVIRMWVTVHDLIVGVFLLTSLFLSLVYQFNYIISDKLKFI